MAVLIITNAILLGAQTDERLQAREPVALPPPCPPPLVVCLSCIKGSQGKPTILRWMVSFCETDKTVF